MAEGRARRRLRLAPAVAALVAAGCAASSSEAPSQPAYTVQHDVVYAERDDGPLHADVYEPAGDGPFPGVLLVHGGAWRRGGKERMARIATRLAEHGYVAVSIDYRLAPAHRFPAQLEDCADALRFMAASAARLDLDPGRIAGFGYSAGGQLVGLLATAGPDAAFASPHSDAGASPPRLRAAVLGGAPVALDQLGPHRVLEDFLGSTLAARPDLYLQASPLHFVSPDDPPVFLYHGKVDWIVAPSQAASMRDALDRAQVPTEYYEAPGGHFAAFLDDAEPVRRAIAFLDRWL